MPPKKKGHQSSPKQVKSKSSPGKWDKNTQPKMKKEPNIPKSINHRNSIRIALIGCVSSGKSTLLNSICVNEYEDMKRKRTTMLPSLYKTTNSFMYDQNSLEVKNIREKNKQLNKKFYGCDSSSTEKLTIDNCEVQEYLIPKIKNFLDLPKGVFLDIYDIPGLNDSTTKEIYFQWIRNNFHQFDIIMNVVSIENGMNTSDEKDILQLIQSCIQKEESEKNRSVMYLSVINKCDDMEIIHGVPTLIDEEDLELYEQIESTTSAVIPSAGFTPITARDTFIYRMLHHDPDVELDESLINKFGINEFGKKKWSRKTSDEKRKFIKQYFKDDQLDIDDVLEQTGYQNFRNKVNTYLCKSTQSLILVNRIKSELESSKLLTMNITHDIEKVKELIKIYNDYCEKVQTIDDIYKTNNSSLITDLIYSHIVRWISDVSDLSNSSEESIERLGKYKEVMRLLRNTIHTYAFKNKVPLKIQEGKDERWNTSFGKPLKEEYNISQKSPRFSLHKIFDDLYEGYSNLQNQYYQRQLNNNNTYEEFPTKLYPVFNNLRENRCENMVEMITRANDRIRTGMNNVTKGPSEGFKTNTDPVSTNCIKEYCDTLMNEYDYPLDLTIEFLQNCLMNKYNVYDFDNSQRNNDEMNYEKSYIFLLETYLENISYLGIVDDKEFLFNLRIVNKSYYHLATTLNKCYTWNSSQCNYFKCRESILCLPMYLVSLYRKKENTDK